MSKVLITESYLEDIADSIRAKNGTQNTYKPSQMASAIDDISGGGTTPTGTKEISITQNGTTTEDVTNYASAEITVNVSASSPTLQTKTVTPSESTQNVSADNGYDGLSQVTVNPIPSSYVQPSGSLSITDNDTYDVSQYASAVVNVSGGGISKSDFADFLAGNLVDLDFSGVTKLRDYALRNSKISNGYFPDLTSIGQYVFYNAQITTGAVVLPSLALLPNHALRSTGATLTAVDTTASTINANCFNGCSAMTKLVLRSPTVATLASTTAFVSTPFDNGGTGGTIYVPNALKSAYQTASNWATLDGYGTVTWKSIEGSAYENAYVDGTAISS